MEQDLDFRIFHKYNRLVRRGLVKPLTCNLCKTPLITSMGEEDELVLTCLSCNTRRTPGIKTIKDIEAVVKEHYLDD